MKNLALIFLIVFILSSCAPATPTIKPAPTATATATPTLTPTATLRPTLTPTLTITASPTLELSSFAFDIAPDVPSKDEEEIKLGIDLARAYMRDYLGGDVSNGFQKTLKVKIVTTGLGDQSPAGGGSCCTFHNAQIFYDVKHPNWNIGSAPYWSNTDHHMNSGAHEYTHAWQSSLGCLPDYQPLGEWITEGTLCDYNDETTPTHNLEYKAEEKMRWLESKSG